MVKASSAVLSWMVRYAAYVYDRFLRREVGQTSLETPHARTFKQSLYIFGVSVLVRVPQATMLPKLEARWKPGLWLGRCTDLDDHLVGTSDDVVQSRACRESLEADCSIIDIMVWMPWQSDLISSKTQEENIPRRE
eukprot:14303949-Heterocapsa_arctica.AAC.1